MSTNTQLISFQINKGLRVARQLLLDLVSDGVELVWYTLTPNHTNKLDLDRTKWESPLDVNSLILSHHNIPAISSLGVCIDS